jgi:ATP/maltotriose-dependent transcriptional regulator MalT
MNARTTTPAIVGRDREVAAIAPFLDGVGAGFGALLFAGPAGIGKTTLWEAAVAEARARGYRVVVSRPTEVETALAFAALNDLFGDLADEGLDELPEPQRIALDSALLRVSAADPPEALAVSVAARHVIRRAAADRPLVLAIDDVQWLDEPSVRVLDFVLRRLDDEHVGVVASRRATDEVATRPVIPGIAGDRLTVVDVLPLSIDGVDRLLRSRLGVELPRPTLLRLHAVAGGNPYYALELGAAIARTANRHDPDVLAVPPSLDVLVGARLAALDGDAETAVLAASAATHPTAALIGAALGKDPSADLARAVAAGVIQVDGDAIRFAHPLIAASAYNRASEDRRREIHRRLADAVDQPEERARHLARAVSSPDAGVADALEAAATAVARRGAPDAAAALAERAADLTPADDRLATRRRLGIAADQHIRGGDIGRARTALQRLVDVSDGAAEQSEALARLAHLLLVQAEWDESGRLYREAAELVDDDPRRRIPIELGLAGVAYVTWQDRPSGAEHAAEALRLAEELADPIVLFQTLGHAASWRGVMGEDWRALMERADELAPVIPDLTGIEHPDLQFARLLRDAGEFDEARRRLTELINRARERGDWHGLPRLLSALAGLEARTGDLDTAERMYREAATGVAQTGEGAWMDDLSVVPHWIRVVRGDVDGARAIEERTSARLEANPLLAHERWSTLLGSAELAFSRGDPAAAQARITPLLELAAAVPMKAAAVCELVVLAIEVSVALGQVDDAATLAGERLPRLRASGVPWIAAEADRAEAVLAAARGDIERARALAVAAVDVAATSGIPMVHGRALLTAGEILRRARQKGQAREALSEAIAIFEKLGARLWLERARTELGRVAVKRPEGAGLTATERQVVDLVAAGRSNKEIADSLFMSVHTVEAHLTRLFRALGVASRTELARLVIEGTDPRLAPADPGPDIGSPSNA